MSVADSHTGGDGQSSAPAESGLTPEKLIERLRRALRTDGDFPASARVVSELRRLTSDPKTTASQITEIILKEPSLGTRVLHLVNSSFYQRARPIMTVSQAVIQIGMKPLAELCSGLVLLQKFVPAARRGGAFASCLQKTICTSLLAGSLSPGDNDKNSNNELGYIAGSFSELGTLLLAYYFPQVYETAVKRAKVKDTDIGTSIHEITGVTPTRLSLEVIDELGLPDFYADVLNIAAGAEGLASGGLPGSPQRDGIVKAAQALNAAEKISNVVVFKNDKKALQAVLASIKDISGIDPAKIDSVIGDLPNQFKDHCSTLEVTLTPLPEFVSSVGDKVETQPEQGTQPEEDQFSQFVEEIRQAIENREPTSSVIMSVMETFAWGLKFDRALLLLVNSDRKKLTGRMLLGKSDIDPQSISRPVPPESSSTDPDGVAFAEARPVFLGDPVFEDGWPFAVIPVGFNDRAIGVIYADRVSNDDSPLELSEQEKAAITMLSELLDRSLSMQA